MATKKTPPKKPTNPPKPDDSEEETPGEGDEEEEDPDEDQDRKINAIVTNRVNRALKPLTKTIEALTAKITELSAPKPEVDEEEDEDQEPTTPKKGKGNAKLTAMEKRLRDAEDRASKAEQAQKDQAEKALRQEENAAIMSALSKSGVTDPKVARAITLALREDELIVRDEETGKIRFKTVDKYGTEDHVDPDSGIGKWLKAEGKAFLPAVPAGGSGAGGTNVGNPAKPISKADAAKLSPRELASINLDRASQGLPPLGQE